ncbi:B12-binding domain-containing radical SAM protein [bacterium]|nr:B12-binding domain-containing radical SAM protein [bacterium]
METSVIEKTQDNAVTKNPVNVAFVNMPARWIDKSEYITKESKLLDIPFGLPLGILYLSSYVKKYNNNSLGKVGCIDYQTHMRESYQYDDCDSYIEQVAEHCLDFEPDVIAFSVMFSTAHYFALKASAHLKKKWPNAVIIFGGMHSSNAVERILKSDDVDYVCKGEGEEAFTAFVDNFHDLKKRNSIKGIYNREAIAVSGFKPITDYIADLDKVPLPDWDLLDMESYIRQATRMRRFEYDEDVLYEKRAAIMMTSRGCPFKCTFCASHTVHGRAMRYRSVENVMEEMRLIHKKFGVNVFAFEDDMFVCSRKQAEELLQEFIKFKEEVEGFEIIFPNALNVNATTHEIIDLMKAAGMKMVNIAIESGSPYVQQHIVKKGVNLGKAKKMIAYLRSIGIITRTGFIIGFPGETKEMMKETIEYIHEVNADWSNINIAAPLVGSEMYDQFQSMDVLPPDEVMWDKDFDKLKRDREISTMIARQFDTKEVSAVELCEIHYKANLEVNFLNNVNLKEGNFVQAERLFEGITREYPFHIFGWWGRMVSFAGMGNTEKALEVRDKILDLIENDSKSKNMYAKYGHMLPGFEPNKNIETQGEFLPGGWGMVRF